MSWISVKATSLIEDRDSPANANINAEINVSHHEPENPPIELVSEEV
jgi:hypothetical protein